MLAQMTATLLTWEVELMQEVFEYFSLRIHSL